MRQWDMLSKLSKSCFRFVRMPVFLSFAESMRRAQEGRVQRCFCGFVLVCVLHSQLQKLGVVGHSHKVSFYFLRLPPNALLYSL